MFFTPDGGLIGALFCPAGDWKMATIAEFLLTRLFDDDSAHFLRLSGKLCRFLHFRATLWHLRFIGVMCVFDANAGGQAGLGRPGCMSGFLQTSGQAGPNQCAPLNNRFVFTGFYFSAALIARRRRY
ncbi:hypothetical protein [Paraburkholderia bryophila]|uniref:Uncharacterized protein n=1 Tax=Paraburkholderia bryophila TaxID=420952 RepID=A0A7Z0AYK8_9BURK|nr:hypothetical protein [Paraburkholderia bryophila]NYH14659.1 hypothetical protein [Paraburkholderia bryophila]NYH27017.1 hypothetical protein [Paraburkholderia bryophila]